jgi:hypothetical protein
MPEVDDPLADLDRALSAAADALVRLPPEQWAAMCREEADELIAMKQLFDVEGWPRSYPPERLLGYRIMEIIAERYPAFASDPAGEAWGPRRVAPDTIDKVAEKHDTKGTITFGSGEFIGTRKSDGTDREQRDDARRKYEAVIGAAQAQFSFQGRDVGKAWQDLRDRWGRELPEVKSAAARVDSPHPLVSTRSAPVGIRSAPDI